jgi:hypothetical protein
VSSWVHAIDIALSGADFSGVGMQRFVCRLVLFGL